MTDILSDSLPAQLRGLEKIAHKLSFRCTKEDVNDVTAIENGLKDAADALEAQPVGDEELRRLLILARDYITDPTFHDEVTKVLTGRTSSEVME